MNQQHINKSITGYCPRESKDLNETRLSQERFFQTLTKGVVYIMKIFSYTEGREQSYVMKILRPKQPSNQGTFSFKFPRIKITHIRTRDVIS